MIFDRVESWFERTNPLAPVREKVPTHVTVRTIDDQYTVLERGYITPHNNNYQTEYRFGTIAEARERLPERVVELCDFEDFEDERNT